MVTIACVQARLASSRYPQKALALLDGHPLIWHVVSRVRQVRGLAAVRLVVPAADADRLSAACAGLAVEVWPTQTVPLRTRTDGTVAAWDVLSAYCATAYDLQAHDWVLRVTGDCPAWRPWVGTGLLALRDHYLAEPSLPRPPWFSADVTCSGWPDGADAELVPVALLRAAASQATWPADREHVTRWLRRTYPPAILAAPHDEGHLKLSIDEPQDLTTVRQYLRAVRSCEVA